MFLVGKKGSDEISKGLWFKVLLSLAIKHPIAFIWVDRNSPSHLIAEIQKKSLPLSRRQMETRNYLGVRFIFLRLSLIGLVGSKMHTTSELSGKFLGNIDLAFLIHICSLSESSGYSIIKLPCILSCVMTIGNKQDCYFLPSGRFRKKPNRLHTACWNSFISDSLICGVISFLNKHLIKWKHPLR